MGSMGKLFRLILLISEVFLLLPARVRSQSLQWTWVSGADTADGSAIYGVRNLIPGDLRPDSRQGASMWIDTSGKIWVFGGMGAGGWHNDLWKYDPVSGVWTWVAGDSTGVGEASYSSINKASNHPGGRFGQSGWVDNSGNFWIFGGTGWDSKGAYGLLNDLWEYDPAANLWTWVSGSDTINAVTNYGTMNSASSSNVPGARSFSSAWVDQSGIFWVFGGDHSPNATGGGAGTILLNDLWKYDPTQNLWTWVSGATTTNAAGVYGTPGTSVFNGGPGSRYMQSGMIDNAGNFWIFGGQGFDGNSRFGYLNDLWKCDASTHKWTWVSGDDTTNSFGSYHFNRNFSPAASLFSTLNKPGARSGQAGWVDSAGNIWIFGGVGFGNSHQQEGYLNDIWVYNPQANKWAVHGSGSVDTIGTYGVKGSASLANIPASRSGAVGMADTSGNYWIFGGIDVNVNTYNDLWKGADSWQSIQEYNANALFQLAWVSGDSSVNNPGNHGLKGAWPTNVQPGKREYHSGWQDNSGKFWIFGGQDNNGNAYNDLWEYDPSMGLWYWMAGDSTPNSNGVYGVKGLAAPGNTPGARAGQAAWVDMSGNLYIYGGESFNGSGTPGYLDDIWKYFPNTRQWAWIGGDSTLNQPGSRMNAAACVDRGTGLFWIYGGRGLDHNGNKGTLADILKYDSTGAGGSILGSVTANISTVYGPPNVEGNTYTPGAREGASFWTYYPPNTQNPTLGNLYLFGGQDSKGQAYSDVWELVYDPLELTLEWAWVGGSKPPEDPGNYGKLGVGSVYNYPPPRSGQITIQDSAENIWIYSGQSGGINAYSDLWKYTPADGKFTWMGGPQRQNQPPLFGVQGVPQTTNAQPGARQGQSGWMDNSGNIWLMGGRVPPVGGGDYPYNDLWELTPLLGTLAIKEVVLSGFAEGDENLLTWQTFDELNTDHFVVQRSIDGIKFDSIAIVAAAGSGNNTYSFTDLRLSASSVFFYRLSVVDKDGSASYSQTIILHAAAAAGLSLYPNPARDMVTLQLKDYSLVNTPLSVLDVDGHLIREVIITGQQQTIDLSGLARGAYLLRLANGSAVSFLKE